MLLTTITCFQDQMVAEEMRAIATRMEADHGIIELAADEALATYQQCGDHNAAILAGIAFVRHLQDGTEPDEPFRWFESWPAVILWNVIAALILTAAVVGLLP